MNYRIRENKSFPLYLTHYQTQELLKQLQGNTKDWKKIVGKK